MFAFDSIHYFRSWYRRGLDSGSWPDSGSHPGLGLGYDSDLDPVPDPDSDSDSGPGPVLDPGPHQGPSRDLDHDLD